MQQESICDGSYYYQYDAWNRLLQISMAVITPTSPGTPGPGEPEAIAGELSFTAAAGALVKHYTYDGLGRLIRTQSPWPNVEDGALSGEVRSERFYYDGIRRIQEVVTDPLLSIGELLMGGGGGGLQQIAEEAAAAEELDTKATTLGLEEGQSAMMGGGSPAPIVYTYVSREYVWGTGDGHAGPDELLVQYGPTRAVWWTLQDAGGDVVAVCDLSGSGSTARVCGQWRYDAYGAATAAEHLHAFPAVRCGHKALFFDRLDSASADSLGNEPPRLIPFAHLVVQMRNRAYMPQLGRFLQPDPNATALTLIEATSFHGRGMGALVAAFDVQDLYGDGMNLYEYLGSSTWTNNDPLGLFLGYDDAIMWGVGGLRGGFEEMVGQYADNMLADVEWAVDWEMGDDWHSRLDSSWVDVSFAMGFYRGMMDQVQSSLFLDGTDAGHYYAGSGAGGAQKGAKGAARVANSIRALNRVEIFESYYQAKKARQGAKARKGAKTTGEQSHHLVEKQIGRDMPWRKNLKGDGPAINVETGFHLGGPGLRGAFNKAYNGKSPTKLTIAEAEVVIRKVYKDAPRLRNKALQYIR